MTLEDTPMAQTVEVDGMTLAEAAAKEGDIKEPLTGAKIARMVDQEEAAAETPDTNDDIPDDPETDACPRCRGWGKTRTGSIVPDQAERDCPTCYGAGWLEREAIERYEIERRERAEQRGKEQEWDGSSN